MIDEESDSREIRTPPSNAELADRLQVVARLLTEQGANQFRVGAYDRASETVRNFETPIWQVYENNGLHGLEEIPGVGRSISRALQQLIRGGSWPLLDRLQGNDVAVHSFATVPGIGPKLARKIHDELGIETLVELQAAAWDGRLQRIPGVGEKRSRAVRESLAARSQTEDRAKTRTQRPFGDDDLTMAIPVAEILSVDNEYRLKAELDELPRIAPRKFNPTGVAWLPILHAQRNAHHYTALFSNTGRAHEMGTTKDWVVIYLEDHEKRGQQGRWTVITSQMGKLRGRRIVRGREKECAEYYGIQHIA